MCHGCAATKTFGFFKVRDRKYADGAGGDPDFGAFLQEMLDDNEQYLREKDVNVIFFVPEEKVITCIDHEQTKRVLRNIMENSMKYRCREQVLIRMNLDPE